MGDISSLDRKSPDDGAFFVFAGFFVEVAATGDESEAFVGGFANDLADAISAGFGHVDLADPLDLEVVLLVIVADDLDIVILFQGADVIENGFADTPVIEMPG